MAFLSGILWSKLEEASGCPDLKKKKKSSSPERPAALYLTLKPMFLVAHG